ncbi:MAG TPA: ABC transporter permease [Blastocatellia bacterium]|nr:ABC transporter permease [Blastocatellia bacterium]
MERLTQDLRYGVRVLRKSPGFTLTAVLALALGIGANSAIFSVINGVLLRPLPFDEPASLVWVWDTQPQLDIAPSSLPDVLDWKEQNQSFEHLAAFMPAGALLDRGDEPEVVPGAMADADLFPLLRVNPILGRTFTADENKPGAVRVVILSHKLWERRFNADPNIVGQPVTLSGNSWTVIGVMPSGFDFPNHSELWRPLAMDRSKTDRGPHFLNVIARLKPAATFDGSQAEMSTIAARIAAAFPEKISGHGIKLQFLHDMLIGDIRPALFVLLGAVGFVLLIACANVANLLLARSASRQKEFAIRSVLGASRFRVIRQLLTESISLSLAGGVIGLLLAYWGVKTLISISPGDIPRTEQIGLDRWVAAFTVLISVATGLVFGLAPALQVSRPDLNEALKEGGRTTSSLRNNRLRGLLVVSEIALALVLLIGAGLMIRSFARLHEVNPGFNSKNVLSMGVALLRAKYPEEQQVTAIFRQLPARLASVPGIVSASAVADLPLTGSDTSDSFTVESRPEPPPNERPLLYYRVCAPGYFKTLGIPLLQGRDFTDSDTKNSPNVTLINEAFARQFFPDEEALGKRLKLQGQERDPLMIIGVVGNVRHQGLEVAPVPEAYVPYSQDPLNPAPSRSMMVVVRTATDPAAMTRALRDAALEVDKGLPIHNVKTMDEYLYESLARRRFNLLLLEVFAVVALALAAVGIYGVVSYSVSQRTHEIGVRLALGANTGNILSMIIRQALALTFFGVALGVSSAFALTQFLSTLLYDVSPTDPLTFAVIPLILSGVALAASLVPARRATRVDPMVALRYE